MVAIAHITDLHLDDELATHYEIDSRKHAINILDDISRREIKRAYITGDCGDVSSVAWLIEELKKRNIEGNFALGNHDEIKTFSNRDEYRKRKLRNKLVYESEFENHRILVLDTSDTKIGLKQLRILEEFLNSADTTIIFSHHPILDCGNTVMDKLFPLKDREKVLASLRRIEKDIKIFCGHYHNEFVGDVENVHQYVTLSALIQLKKSGEKIERANQTYGYRIIHFENREISTESVAFEDKN